MDKALVNKLQQIKLRGTFNGDDLFSVVANMVDETQKAITQKRNQIERIIGEIKATMATRDLLLKVLDKHLSSEKQTEAEILREQVLIEIKRKEAQERVAALIEQDGIDFNGAVVKGGSELDLPSSKDILAQIQEETKEKNKKSKAKRRR